MKKEIFKALSLVFLLAACSKNNVNEQLTDTYQWVFQDSIQVDFMGELFLMDYDPLQEWYLGRWNAQEEYVVFDKSGIIKHTFKLTEDGPNKIGWATGVNLLDGKICVMDQTQGIFFFELDGTISSKLPIVEDYFHINGLPFGAHRSGDEFLYFRPERGASLEDFSAMYKNVYSADILEIYNASTGRIRTSMPFPPNTVYSSGNFYNWTFPGLYKYEDEWILWMLAEQKYFVYKEQEGEIVFSKVVDLNLNGALPMPGIPMPRYQDWYEEHGNVMFGRIEQIYRRESDVVVIYTKGVSEDIASQYSRDDWEEWSAFLDGIQRYAAIFDSNHELIQKDILVPKGIWLSSVVHRNGAIIAQKNQEYFSVEEDYLTFYQLNLDK
ncbi:hypothetical protein [Mongoliitalea daihaiensis]|uniref:hypothetical protein n=1 Tax=Mongoliitalea daihaiensis TaxID=2782006 RepID=UPI001F43842C|nr:hypothetical protein [Mongoliitalea daihaiensis]UJP64333.1 hypothetical protein IPZ59_16195 [Mongoliitalea daihaiensis]